MTKSKQAKFGAIIFGDGGNHSSWRTPDITPGSSIDFEHYRSYAKAAERAMLDFLFIVDFSHTDPDAPPHLLNQFEPMTLLSALASVTSKIGLVATGSTSFIDPFTLARQFASLDMISDGRAGWNLVTSGREGAAANFSQDEHMEHDERYRRAVEHLEVVRGLWDSWEDDAFVYDVPSGVYYERAKLHTLSHKGEYFSVKGPLPIQRSKQGQPVVFQAGLSEAGRSFAASHCDVVFSSVKNFDESRSLYRELKSRAATAGRDPEAVLLLCGTYFLIGDTTEEAEALYKKIKTSVSIESALKVIGRFFGYHDFSQYPLDAPFPELGDLGDNGQRTGTSAVKKMAHDEALTLREVALRCATPRSAFIGTVETVADEVERWISEGASDGFMLYGIPDNMNLQALGKILPELTHRGLFRSEYEGSTLRSHLGLPFASNRYAGARG
jgi:FMN-dependent oxidoreductase (nitrilotriacetate monooxygenase family)